MYDDIFTSDGWIDGDGYTPMPRRLVIRAIRLQCDLCGRTASNVVQVVGGACAETRPDLNVGYIELCAGCVSSIDVFMRTDDDELSFGD